jgi:hypothetical protein
MRIDWLVPARYAELSEAGTMNILGGGIDTLVVPQTPVASRLEVFIAMRIAGLAQEWRSDHTVSVSFTRNGAGRRVVYDKRLLIPEARILDPDRDIGVLIAARCRWQSTNSEQLEFKVALDGENRGRVEIAVVGPKPATHTAPG